MYSLFTVYNRNTQGLSVVTGTQGESEVALFSTGSVTQSRAALTEFKRTNNLPRTRTVTNLDCGFETNAPLAQAIAPQAALPISRHNAVANPATAFSVEKRFEMLEEVTAMVLGGEQRAELVIGNGGSGKTFTILQVLRAAGLEEVEIENLEEGEELEEGDDSESSNESTDDNGKFLKVTGATSPIGLYRTLYTHRKATIVFDDCDSVFSNQNSVNILKAVLDTSGDGTVTWASPGIERAGLPSSFRFDGKVIFISNKKYHQVPQPLLSRALILDMDMTSQDILARARMLAKNLLPRLSEEQREEMFSFAEENLSKFRDVSLRMFVLSEPYWRLNKPNRKDLMLFTN